MRNQNGITLVALVVYVIVFSIIIATMTMISNNFFTNVKTVRDSPKYISEFNKFSMFFVQDVKKNTNATSITDTKVIFGSGDNSVVYEYKNGGIYRNDLQIAKYVKSFKFTSKTYTVNSITKKLINVNTTIGNSKEEVQQNIDFVLKYW